MKAELNKVHQNPRISVIVAVYKAEKYLQKCVDSLCRQTFRDIEILLIDDGSPDHSGEICDEYAKQDSRIRVFHRKNGGVSSARQCGIDNARGEYTIHADPDDWVEPMMLEILYKKAVTENADMVICDHYTEDKGGFRYVKQTPTSLQPTQVLKDLFHRRLSCVLWNKLIRLTCYKTHNASFPVGMDINEDLYIIVFLLRFPLVISYLPAAFYHHTTDRNPNMLSQNKDFRSFQLMEKASDKIAALLNEENRNEFTILREMSLAFSTLSYQWMDGKTFRLRFGYLSKNSPNSRQGIYIKIALKSYWLGKLAVRLSLNLYHALHYKKTNGINE